MAIYSLNHSAIGRATQERAYTAAAHVRYVSRRKACVRMLAARMPATSAKAQRWLRQQEDQDRKNARVCDKVLLALPRELDAGERAELVRAFAEEVTGGRASWLAAFHEKGKDTHNPHCHLLIRDRDPETGKRVCNMSERGSTERLRLLWEKQANLALERAGREERIDRRTLKAQGIARRPMIHEGLSAREMRSQGKPARSRPRQVVNGVGARTRQRVVDYRKLDQGRSRPDYNEYLRETEAEYWAALDADLIAREWLADDERRRKASAQLKRTPIELPRERLSFSQKLDQAGVLKKPIQATGRWSARKRSGAGRRNVIESVSGSCQAGGARTPHNENACSFLQAFSGSTADPSPLSSRSVTFQNVHPSRAQRSAKNAPLGCCDAHVCRMTPRAT